LHEEVKMASSMEQRRLPATLDSVIAEKRGDVQFGLVGSLERNARKLEASGPPPPSLRAKCLRHLRVVGRGAFARGPGGPK
jgi:hypothetical protein